MKTKEAHLNSLAAIQSPRFSLDNLGRGEKSHLILHFSLFFAKDSCVNRVMKLHLATWILQ